MDIGCYFFFSFLLVKLIKYLYFILVVWLNSICTAIIGEIKIIIRIRQRYCLLSNNSQILSAVFLDVLCIFLRKLYSATDKWSHKAIMISHYDAVYGENDVMKCDSHVGLSPEIIRLYSAAL